MSYMTDQPNFPAILRSVRAALNLTQEQLAERLGVSFATVNRWEGGGNRPQRAAQEAILALAAEAGVDGTGATAPEAADALDRRAQMLWEHDDDRSHRFRRPAAGQADGR